MRCWLDFERIDCRPGLSSTVVILTEIVFTEVSINLDVILCIESIRVMTKINIQSLVQDVVESSHVVSP